MVAIDAGWWVRYRWVGMMVVIVKLWWAMGGDYGWVKLIFGDSNSLDCAMENCTLIVSKTAVESADSLLAFDELRIA